MIKFEMPKNGKTIIYGLNIELESIYINELYKNTDSDVLVVTNSIYESNKLYNSIINYNKNVFLFEMDDFVTSEASITSPELKINRLETINNIVFNKNKKVVITNLMGLLRYLPNKNTWKESLIKLKVGDNKNKEDLYRNLCRIGYQTESLVTKTGEISNRGYILDIFPINEENPIRIEFFGDEIESIRYFDINTQLTINKTESIDIFPIDEFIIDKFIDEKKQKNLKKYIKTNNIKEYLNNPTIVYSDYDQIYNSYLLLSEEMTNYSEINKEENDYMYELNDIYSNTEIYISDTNKLLPNLKIDNEFNYNCESVKNYNDDFKQLNTDISMYLSENKTIIICLKNEHQANNLKKYIEYPIYISNYENVKNNKINVVISPIESGYIIDNLVVLSESNLFKNVEVKNTYKSKFKYGTKISNIDSLSIGDYVVHNMHGIGVYLGIIALKKGSVIKDYLQIKYGGNDKLYIPVEKIDLITKYSSNEGSSPKLNKLNGIEWAKTKYRIKAKLESIAQELIKVAAERKLKQGFAFKKDILEQAIFESEFIYDETEDQLKATKIIKEAMEQEYPMDMLLCGDVGYGKTEVAFRAIFKAIYSGKQVAYLCPTTILSNQQYNSAISRFRSFPVNIALLNRFTTKKEVIKILNDLKNNKIDLLIGTHRILSKDVEFSDLGLLVIDEEQRFGVNQKEQIKKYKANIDILTLSATPIPRTLQMSMVGIRDLALISTPPSNRYPIQTYVLEENNYVIKDAIYKELSRDGQVYILCNKINEFEDKINEIKKLIPNIKVGYAHGKMNKTEIEDIMDRFINKEFNVLLCTTIIETGIDIPNVNTLIIVDADKFGLSQLYQIRGRVGRTNRIAYAYLMYSKKKILSEIATKRLSSIKEFAQLGSGFSIAMRDLSIRGAGDILGQEQSGFIDSVGIELYTKMINEEVNKLKGIEVIEEDDEEPNLLNVETHISDEYVKEDSLKIEIHKKINEINSYEKLSKIKSEIEDRFGKVSENIIIYMHEELFENLKSKNGIEKVVQMDKSIEIIFNEKMTNELHADELFVKAYKICKDFKLSYSFKRLRITLNTNNLERHWIYYILDLLKVIWQ